MIPLHHVTTWLSPFSPCQTRSRALWLCPAHLSTGTRWLQKRLLVGTDVYCEKGLRARCEEKDPSSLVSLSLFHLKRIQLTLNHDTYSSPWKSNYKEGEREGEGEGGAGERLGDYFNNIYPLKEDR